MTISETRPVDRELTERRGPYGINNALRRKTNALHGDKLFPDELPLVCLRLISEFNPTTDPETKFAIRGVNTKTYIV